MGGKQERLRGRFGCHGTTATAPSAGRNPGDQAQSPLSRNQPDGAWMHPVEQDCPSEEGPSKGGIMEHSQVRRDKSNGRPEPRETQRMHAIAPRSTGEDGVTGRGMSHLRDLHHAETRREWAR